MAFWSKKQPMKVKKKTVKEKTALKSAKKNVATKKTALKSAKKKPAKKKVASSRGRSKCALAINAAEDEVRNTLNWLSVFAMEYDLADEVVTKLRSKLKLIARKVGNIPC